MKRRAKILAVVLMLSICLIGCGKKDEADSSSGAGQTTQASASKLNGTTESWGVYSEVFVPDGMTLTASSTTDKEDQNYVRLIKNENMLDYIYFNISTEEQCQKDVAATKNYNKDSDKVSEMKEVSVKAGSYEWTGISYMYETYGGTSPVVHMYAVIGDKAVNVRMAGFSYDSEIAKAILESIKLN